MKALRIFYILFAYVIVQFCWWGYLLAKEHNKLSMLFGEGFVFLGLLSFGAWRFHKALKEEALLNQRQKNFLLSVTHELKSPLASIKLYLQTILKRDLSKEQSEGFLNNSLKDIERLDELVENMLVAGRIESKSYNYAKDSLNFSDLVEECLLRFERRDQSKHPVQRKIDPNIQLIGDRFTLGLAINNLLENAAKYSATTDRISLSLHKSNHQVHLSITDEGIGIPDSEKMRVFEKFYRIGNEDTRKTKGTGLGLFIVKQILENHRADIRIRNNQPKGSIFDIHFLLA